MKIVQTLIATSLLLSLNPLSNAYAAEQLHVYNWANYFGERTLENFTKETGIEVVYDTYDSDEVLLTKLLTGNTGYDVAFPGAAFAADMAKANLFQKIDPKIVVNRAEIDPEVMKGLMPSDPGMEYFIPYTTAVTGFAYNVNKITVRLPGVTLDGWAAIFDSTTAEKLSDCGISVIDAPNNFVGIGLRLNSRPVGSMETSDLDAASATLSKLRPGIRYINSAKFIGDLANGDLCLAITWTNDGLIAKARAEEANKGVKITVVVPKEGSVFQANVAAIPANARNSEAANLFINYLQRHDIHADIISYVFHGTANRGATAKLSDELGNSPGVTLTTEQAARMWPAMNSAGNDQRTINRLWTKFRTGL